MKRIKRVFVRVHLILWILFGFMAYLQLSQRNSNCPILIVALLLTCLCAFYGYYFLLSRYPGKKKALAYWLGLIAILAIAPLIYLLIQEIQADSPNSLFDQYIIDVLSIAMPFVILSWLAKLVETLVLNTVKKEQLEKQAAEAELYYLKSQTNPHFLFNTLNNIHTLVYKQAPTAPDAVMQLASLMRYMIYESNAPTVPLSREISYLKDYISLRLYQEQSLRWPLEQQKPDPEPGTGQEYIFLKVGHRIQKLTIGNILYVEGMKDYLQIHTRKEKFMTLMNFAKVEELLPSQRFARVHSVLSCRNRQD